MIPHPRSRFERKLSGFLTKCVTQMHSGLITLLIIARGPCAAAAYALCWRKDRLASIDRKYKGYLTASKINFESFLVSLFLSSGYLLF